MQEDIAGGVRLLFLVSVCCVFASSCSNSVITRMHMWELQQCPVSVVLSVCGPLVSPQPQLSPSDHFLQPSLCKHQVLHASHCDAQGWALTPSIHSPDRLSSPVLWRVVSNGPPNVNSGLPTRLPVNVFLVVSSHLQPGGVFSDCLVTVHQLWLRQTSKLHHLNRAESQTRRRGPLPRLFLS